MTEETREVYTVDFEVLPNGNLLFTANDTAKAELADGWNDHHDWDRQWYDIMGPFQENGDLYPVDPEDVAALTSAPIVTDDFTIEDDGTRKVVGKVWWFPDYQITDPLEVLRDTGRVEFTLATVAESGDGPDAWLMDGDWFLDADNHRNLYIVPRPDVVAECEGPDDDKMDAINAACRDHDRLTDADCERIGLDRVADFLKRWERTTGYYTA